MPARNITIALLGFALLLTAILLSTNFPQSRILHTLSYSLSRSEELAGDDLDTLAIALGRYHTATRTYPTTTQGLAALVIKLTAPIPLDPWGRPYQYQLLEEEGLLSGRLELYSLGPDGVVSDDDLESDIDLTP